MLQLMLRLKAIQVISDVLIVAMEDKDEDIATIISGFTDTMQMVLNIYKFASSSGTQWRQHILLSTTFLDGATTALIQTLLLALQCSMEEKQNIPGALLYGLNLSFKFGTITSYHLGKAGNELRGYCTFFHDAFLLSIKSIVNNAHLSGQFMVLYVNLLHFMCNVDALSDDSVLSNVDLLP
uniref:Phosphate transporter PHO1 n=1 Tax=Lygus hesperus TaxID=30085 RepID=A0A0A9YS71_LYGHE